MKLTLNIEADSPEELTAILGRLGPGTAVDPLPAAAKATRTKAEPKPTETASSTASSALQSGSTVDSVSAAPVQQATSTALETSAPTETALVAVTEADLVAAANAAAAKLGPSGPAKLKAHIAGKFTKADGTPGTLKQTRPEHQALLLADLQQIARGELAL